MPILRSSTRIGVLDVPLLEAPKQGGDCPIAALAWHGHSQCSQHPVLLAQRVAPLTHYRLTFGATECYQAIRFSWQPRSGLSRQWHQHPVAGRLPSTLYLAETFTLVHRWLRRSRKRCTCKDMRMEPRPVRGDTSLRPGAHCGACGHLTPKVAQHRTRCSAIRRLCCREQHTLHY